MSPLTRASRCAVPGESNAALSHVSFVSGFGSSCSHPLFANRPSRMVGSGLKLISRPVIEPEPEPEPELEPELELEPEAEPELEPEIEAAVAEQPAEPAAAPQPEPEQAAEEPDYIDIEPDEITTIEPEPPRAPKAGAPSSSPGVPYKPEVEPAAE